MREEAMSRPDDEEMETTWRSLRDEFASLAALMAGSRRHMGTLQPSTHHPILELTASSLYPNFLKNVRAA